MRRHFLFFCLALALSSCGFQPRAHAPDPKLDALFVELAAAPDAQSAAAIEIEIRQRWSESASATVDVLLRRAQAAETAGEAERAFAFLEEAAKLAPDFAEPWNQRASLFYSAQDYPHAIAAIQEALKREPRHFAALTALGRIYEALGQDRRALEAYRAALAVHPFFDPAKRAADRLSARVEGQPA